MASFLGLGVAFLLTLHTANAGYCEYMDGQCLHTTTCPTGMTSRGAWMCDPGEDCCAGPIPCGDDAAASGCSHPWIVSLKRHIIPIDDDVHMCGGVLVHPEWVLTTARCALVIFQPFPNYNGAVVVAGEQTLSTPSGKEQIRNATAIHFHPGYHARSVSDPGDIDTTKSGEFDFAMIKVATPYTAFGGDECASVVCLPMNDTVVSCDTDVEISGWGSAAIGGAVNSDTMKKADVKLWDLESCKYLKFIFDNDHSVTHESTLCYTSVPAAADKDLACDTDGGGPVVFKMPNGKYSLYGILNAERGNCKARTAHRIGNVISVVDWIKSFFE